MKIIDLRSDTVTQPTEAMREAMFRAEVGDDVFGDDPTVNKLEAVAAEITGKEAGLFVPSGTMGNLICLLTHCGRGDEAILGNQSHIFVNEAGGIAALGGIHPHPIPNQPDGTMDLGEVEGAIRDDNIHFPRTRLICLENTHNRCYGAPLTPQYMESVAAIARRHKLAIHLDGARIFNAAVALGVPVLDLVRPADSLIFCISKGLAAPVGSLVCGSTEFIRQARRKRKQLGGGMRQAGILAAAGIIALEGMIERLAEDHLNARLLANELSAIDGLRLEPDRVATNIVYCELISPKIAQTEFLRRIKEKGVLVSVTGKNRFRMLSHYGVSREDIFIATAAIREAMAGAPGSA